MYQQFNQDNMLTKFIKNLLETTYIPTVQIWYEGKPIIKDLIYITKDYIVKAKKSWSGSNGDVGPRSSLDQDYFKIIEPYIRGKFYRGLTSNYVSNTSNYDSKTHYNLGQYLRSIRDLDGIDLMQYYNCWDGRYSDTIRFQLINGSIDINQKNTINDGLKTLLIPIKFNKKYTIYINSNTPVTLLPVYYDGINIRTDPNITNINSYVKSLNCSMTQPLIFNGVNSNSISSSDNLNLHAHEMYLTLLIQLAESNSSHIVVLEGEYKTKLITIMNDDTTKLNRLPETVFGDTLDNIADNDLDSSFRSVPSLIHTVSNKNYAFSNRLIEYLLLNVITKDESINNNIERIQKYASSYKCLENNKVRFDDRNSSPDIWDKYLRKFNYDLSTQFYLSPLVFDINGYVDKDTESILLRGK